MKKPYLRKVILSAVAFIQVLPSSRAYADCPTPDNKSPHQIAIVLDDMGPENSGSEEAIKLPPDITLSFMPFSSNPSPKAQQAYHEKLQQQTQQAHELCHEEILHMPMEPLGYTKKPRTADAGPGALLVDAPLEENRRNLVEALGSFPYIDGLNNHEGSRFTAFRPGMDMVMQELLSRGKFFFDSRTIGNSVGMAAAQQAGVLHVGRDIFLDDDMLPAAVNNQFALLDKEALKNGHAVAIGHPRAVTLAALKKWLPLFEEHKIALLPLHRFVRGFKPSGYQVEISPSPSP